MKNDIMVLPEMDIGISTANRQKIADGLSALLADSYTLYLMTHNFHWNVTGPQFNSLHNMFMDQYTEQWNALDIIAERSAPWDFRHRVPTRNLYGSPPSKKWKGCLVPMK